jgi:hypothetical protein
MKSILIIAFLAIQLIACNQEALPAPTSIPDNLANTPVSTTIFTSPIEITTPPVSESPLAEIDTTEQIIVTDAYERMYHYQFAYSPEEWQLKMDAWHDGSAAPELLHRAMEGCRMILRDGARGQSTGVIMVEKTLAGLAWFVYSQPQFQPNVATYTLPQPDKGLSFFITLVWPEEASEEFIAACQAAAEVE